MLKIFKRKYIIKQLFHDVQNGIVKDGQHVNKLNGYITNINKLKNFTFVDIMDGTTSSSVKLVLSNKNNNIQNITLGDTIQLNNWNVVLTPNRTQFFELQMNSPNSTFNISHSIDLSLQYNEKNINLSTLRNTPLHKFKNNYMASLQRFRSHLELTLFNILSNKFNFIKTDPPIITTNDTEGNNETFKLTSTNSGIFPLNAPNSLNLTVSAQLHLEILAQSLSNVYSLTPCFRAERSDTGRHLTEFWMLELETTEYNTLDELVSLTKNFIISTLKDLLKNQKVVLDWDELINHNNSHKNYLPLPMDTMTTDQISDRWERIANPKNWHEIDYVDVIKELDGNSNAFTTKPPTLDTINENNINSEHEKWVSSTLFSNGFVFIKNYPKSLKPFYMKNNINNKKLQTVQCFDLIFPELGEIIGGSMREDNYEKLIPNVSQDLDWYVQLRRSGYRTSGGFGLGLERFIAYILGVKSIKDTLPFYRSAKSKVTL
ncbi:asparagine--tRNA ligase SLM5 PWA37_001956 [Arxiozyma heterogenica]|uniref:Aminoacyl-transfer RNA synthetases class-II family profile domain-containing protein n=1 Tax=Arxiozyma heterogenica TaxID=278026 RepID=A0AAN7WIX5_9SACH|nr:hypothetical protein RI543_001428 [Kazachstania heterogenica]